MNDESRDLNLGELNTSPREIAVSEFYGTKWNPGRIGPLLTALYDAGALKRIGSRKYAIVRPERFRGGVIVDCSKSMAEESNKYE